MKKILFFLLVPLSLQGQGFNILLIDSLMQAEFAYNQFNGNVLIAKSGNIMYEKSFGYRNYDTKELLDKNSVFDLASISKQFTAMGILLLKEKGLLKLSDTLQMYFPELPYHNITIKHMLTHTSGLPDYASPNVIGLLPGSAPEFSKENPQLELDWAYADSSEFSNSSDHYAFQQKGIPSVFFFNGLHADWHRPTDDAEKIDYEYLQKNCQFIYRFLLELANE